MVHMADTPLVCDPHLDLFPFTYPLRHFSESVARGRRTRVVALGSSSTAGEPSAPDWQVKIVPYPARLELALRRRYFGSMIDVLNRGLSGQDAAEELSRIESDVIAEAPALVIWQVGSNAVFHELNTDEIAAAISTGLRWLARLPMDVVLMDLQYTTALTTSQKIGLSTQIQKIILDAAAQAKINVFRRWDLMKKWVDDRVATIDDLTDPADVKDHLHMSEWATACVSRALVGTILNAPPPPSPLPPSA
jgi:acyl-CoA thioesterase-1